MRRSRITPNPLCEAHQLMVNLAREFRETICQKTQWSNYGYMYRIRRNSHLNRQEAEEVAEVKKAILTKALETCR